MDPLIGRVLNGRFSILEPIGAGGMGRVYKAVQSPLDRMVAVKVLHPHYAGRDPGFVRRFVMEAALTSKLRHPNTVTVIDYGQSEDGIFYIAMEYLEGKTVAELLTRDGPFHWSRALVIGQQVCRSLREAHKLGIVHRDLKPANVMLLDEADQDVVKVLDFGLVKSFGADMNGPSASGDASDSSKITQAGMLLGSPQYMAPEQARNVSDPRSDVYSFGILMYEMMMGKPPFLAKDYLEVIVKHLKEQAPRFRQLRPDLTIPDEVEALVFRCLQKEPQHRFQSMDEVLDALRKTAQVTGIGLQTSGMIDPARSGIVPNVSQTPPPMQLPRPGALTPRPGVDPLSGLPVTPHPMMQPTPAPIPLGSGPMAAPGSRSGSHAVVPPVQHGPPAANVFASASEPPPQSKLLWVLAAVAGLLVVSGVGVVVLRDNKPSAPPPATAEAPKPVETPKPAEVAPAAAAGAGKLVRFKVTSEPAGARVFQGARDLGETPLTFEMPATADGTATAELVFILDGYHPLAATAGGSGDVVLTQRLQRKSGGPAESPRENSRGRSSSSSSGGSSSGSAASTPYEKFDAPQMVGEVARAEPTRAPEPAGTAAAPVPGGIAPAAAATPAPAEPASVAAVAKPTTSSGAEILSFGEGMTRPDQIEGKPIEYSREAIQAKVEGLMIVKCVINTTGRLESCKILKGLPYMDKAVLDSLYSRLYKPVTYQGRPVAVSYVFDIRLVLPKR